MSEEELIEWLLKGDVSIQYQTKRDLLGVDDASIQASIQREGWGKRYLSKRNDNGHWGMSFYQPKWISTHYTLLDLRNLCISPTNELVKETVDIVLSEERAVDGGMLPHGKYRLSDVCVTGMVLNYVSYFKAEEKLLESMVDSILEHWLPDGGFNCMSNRQKVKHSSLHSTLSTCEGITEFEKNGYKYRLDELKKAKSAAIEFILLHQLFLSDRTGAIIRKDFLQLTNPARWKYNILRALDYLRYEGVEWDDRMRPAIDVLLKKRNKGGSWNVQSKHAGKIHFELEKAGKPSRLNTLIALRVMRHFKIEI